MIVWRKIFAVLICVCFLIGAVIPSLAAAENTQDGGQRNFDRYYRVIYAHIQRTNPSLGPDWTDWMAKAYIILGTKWGVNPLLVTAFVYKESRHNPYPNDSPAGAIGPAQLMPGTAAQLGIGMDAIRDPAVNLEGGVRYLRQQLDTFGNQGVWSTTYAVAAYNAGPQAIIDHGGVPGYSETVDYIQDIGRVYQRLINDFNNV